MTCNIAAVAKTSVSTQTFTVTGLTTSHIIVITSKTALAYGTFITAASASGSNTMSLTIVNTTGSSVTLGNTGINYIAWTA